MKTILSVAFLAICLGVLWGPKFNAQGSMFDAHVTCSVGGTPHMFLGGPAPMIGCGERQPMSGKTLKAE